MWNHTKWKDTECGEAHSSSRLHWRIREWEKNVGWNDIVQFERQKMCRKKNENRMAHKRLSSLSALTEWNIIHDFRRCSSARQASRVFRTTHKINSCEFIIALVSILFQCLLFRVIFVNWKYFPYSMSTHNRSQETILFFFEFEPNKKWELRTKKMQQKNFYVFGLARHGKNQTKLRLRRKKEFVLRQQSSLLPSMLCTRARLRLCGCTNGQLKRNKNNWETQTKANAAMRRWSPLQWKDHDVKDANNGCDCRI